MTIRVATVADRDQVLHVLNQLGEVVNTRVHFDPDNIRAHELGKENYEAAMKRDDRKVFVAVDGKKIIGVATLFILTDFITAKVFAHLDDFIVDKKHRRKGVGTKLLSFVLNYAKAHGILTVELTSSLELTDAHTFYEKRGGVFARKVIKFCL